MSGPLRYLKWVGVAVILIISKPAIGDAASHAPIDGSALHPGCSVVFEREYLDQKKGSGDVPPFFLFPVWQCDDQRLLIDRYEINGGSPEVVDAMIWNRKGIVVLVKWSVSSRAADFSGDYYRVFIYRRIELTDAEAFVRDCTLMSKFPEGWDGEWKNGESVVFEYKDATSLRRKIAKIWTE